MVLAGMRVDLRVRRFWVLAFLVAVIAVQPAWGRSKNQNTEQLRAEYLRRVMGQPSSIIDQRARRC